MYILYNYIHSSRHVTSSQCVQSCKPSCAIDQTVHYVCILAKTKYYMQQCTNKLIDFYNPTRHKVTLTLATFKFQLLEQT